MRAPFANQDVLADYVKDDECANCGSAVDLTMDHIIPISRDGGTDDESNIQTLCRSCNSSKGDSTPSEWEDRKILKSSSPYRAEMLRQAKWVDTHLLGAC